MKGSQMKLRISPLLAGVAGVAGVAALAVVPATAETPSPSPSAASASPSAASASPSVTSVSPSATSVSPSATSASPAGSGSAAASAAKPAAAKVVPIGYKCMLLGEYVPVSLTYTVPADLVRASAKPVPAGRTFGTVARGSVPLRTRVTLSKAALTRLKLVDQRTIGGRLRATLWFGSTPITTVYTTPTTAIRPASDGTQSQYVSRDLSNLVVTGSGATTAVKGLTAPVHFTTNVMIPGFQWASCTVASAKTSRSLIQLEVVPATIVTSVAGAQVTATVRNGDRGLATGTVTETLTGTSNHKAHRSTVQVKLTKGVAVRSWRKTMTGFGLTSATVSVSYAGRTVNVRLHI